MRCKKCKRRFNEAGNIINYKIVCPHCKYIQKEEFNLSEKIVAWRIMSKKELKEVKNYRLKVLETAVKGAYEVELEHRIALLKKVEKDVKEFIKRLKEFEVFDGRNKTIVITTEKFDNLAGDEFK